MSFLEAHSLFPGRRLPNGQGALSDEMVSREAPRPSHSSFIAKLFPIYSPTCANPICSGGRLHSWGRGSSAVFEGAWTCSYGCLRTQVAWAVHRELESRIASPSLHRHRLPLGLTMLEQGWITIDQLRGALRAQREAGGGRFGHWLMRKEGIDQELVSRALGLQWSCPVLSAEPYHKEALTAILPRLFVDAFGALPLRVSARSVVYLGFEDRLDPVVALGIERTSAMRVESGIVQGSQFASAHDRILSAQFPKASLIEGGSEAAIVHAFARAVERARPANAQLARIHDFLWLRMVLRVNPDGLPEVDAVEDLICSIGTV